MSTIEDVNADMKMALAVKKDTEAKLVETEGKLATANAKITEMETAAAVLAAPVAVAVVATQEQIDHIAAQAKELTVPPEPTA